MPDASVLVLVLPSPPLLSPWAAHVHAPAPASGHWANSRELRSPHRRVKSVATVACGSPARSLSPAVPLAPDSQDLHVHTCRTFPDGLLDENCLHGANTKSWQVARSELVVWLLLPREYEYEWRTLEMPIYHIKMLTGNKLTNALIYLIFHYEPNTHNTILLLTFQEHV